MDRAERCEHRKRTFLGVDGLAYFYHCETCGTVVVLQGGRMYRVKPTPAS